MVVRRTFLLAFAFPLLLHSQDIPVSPAIEKAARLEEEGRFIEATTVLGTAIALQISSPYPEIRKQLEFELDRLDRIRIDYSLTKERLFENLVSSVRNLNEAEFESWVEEGRFDSRVIDSVQYFAGPSVSNLFFRYPELSSRRLNPPDRLRFEQSTLSAVQMISAASAERRAPFVLPKTFHNAMTVTLKANAIPAGETVRAWLPIPRAFPHQISFRLLTTSSPVVSVGDYQSPIRSVVLEQKTVRDQPTVFHIEYEYTVFGIRFDLQPAAIRSYDPDSPIVVQYTTEEPHVVFTDRIKQLSQELAGADTNALVKAKKFYDWISENIKYSYALEYSTIRNISDYCLRKMYGDCGQEALLFITLCRYNGIPARWQSGWLTIPGGKTIHDWTEIYLMPYGWVPVDPYMGVFAMQYFKGPEDQRKEIRDFYFGGLDQYRMAANSDHSQKLTPPKRSMRSDNVDFQRGELEYGGTNIYFDKYSYDLKVEEIVR